MSPPHSHHPNGSVLTVSPPDSNFIPRREFVRDNHVPSDFALLAIASAGLVRLTAFPQDLVAVLRRTFQQRQGIRTIKEEKSLNLVEFSLEQKPWSATKNVDSQKLFLDVLTIIFQYGFNFVSTIDYGREQDDRLSIAFSKSKPASTSNNGTRSGSPAPAPHPTLVKVPFALSFASSTVLRVINPPLNSTPAILKSVRSAWPRGVISERTLSDNCFEFKLKGYGWFQEDTFSADSLLHVLALLNALDSYAFTLITSLSLSGSRSRVRDLWIFSGPPQELSEILNDSRADLSRTLPSRGLYPSNEFGRFEPHHARSSSLPMNMASAHTYLSHARTATEPNAMNALTQPRSLSPKNSHSVLRKKSSLRPLASSPSSSQDAYSPVKQSFDDPSPGQRKFRISDDGNVDMTGVGSAAQRAQYFTSPGTANRQITTIDTRDTFALANTKHEGRDARETQDKKSVPHPEPERIDTGDLFYVTSANDNNEKAKNAPDYFRDDTSPDMSRSASTSDSSRQLTPRDDAAPPNDVPQSVYGQVFNDAVSDPNANILSPEAFRDSAFSSGSSQSYEIPISWTGPESDKRGHRFSAQSNFKPNRQSQWSESGFEITGRRGSTFVRRQSPLNLPGGWNPSPIEEKSEDQHRQGWNMEGGSHGSHHEVLPERKEVDAERVASPTKSDQLAASRKSETVLYGMVPEKLVASRQGQRLPADSPPSPVQPIGSGWVLVNIDSARQRGSTSDLRRSGGENSSTHLSNQSNGNPEGPALSSSMSPVAKVIAAADAVAQPEEERPSKLKRLIGKSKSKSRKLVVESGLAKVKSFDVEEDDSRKLSIAQRWRK